jgi:hypothetical protein
MMGNESVGSFNLDIKYAERSVSQAETAKEAAALLSS